MSKRRKRRVSRKGSHAALVSHAAVVSHGGRGRRHWGVAVGVALVVLCVALVAYAVRKPAEPAGPVADYTVVHAFPHDPEAFTQGFEFYDGFFYEGTGEYGESSVRRVELKTGKVVQIEKLPERYFGEGTTLWGDRIIQVTWKSGVGFDRDRKTLRTRREFRYAGEGWGLTHDSKRLIMSDGTSTLRFLDPETLKVTGSLKVKDHGRPIRNLNELELVGDEIYANIWQTDRIARISASTGNVTGWIDLTGLRSRALKSAPRPERVGVLNGIAYDAAGDRLFVTGKRWPLIFEIRVAKHP